MNHPLPEAFLNDMQKLLGNEYPAFLRAMDAPAALALLLTVFGEGPARARAKNANGWLCGSVCPPNPQSPQNRYNKALLPERNRQMSLFDL